MLSMSCPVRFSLVVQELSFTSPIERKVTAGKGVVNNVDVLGELLATDVTTGSLPKNESV